MKFDSTLEPETTLAREVDSGGCAPMYGSLASPEMVALEASIQHNDHELARVQTQLEIMHRKQAARRQELGYQKARVGMKLSRVSDTPIDGARMVVVQTDSGIATRWIRPENEAMEIELNAALAELRAQWEMNHHERCTNMRDCKSFGGPKECHCPRPNILPVNVKGHAAAGASHEKQEPTASPSHVPACSPSSILGEGDSK